MARRYLSIWFKNLVSDWLALKTPALAQIPFVLTEQDRGRIVITAASPLAAKEGIQKGMSLVDARILLPGVQVIDSQAGRAPKLLKALAQWCIRYTPVVAVDGEDGLLLDITGCAYLWGGERMYFKEIILRLRGSGYNVRGAIADTVGAAWAIARYGKISPLIEPGEQKVAIYDLPPVALRLPPDTLEQLYNFGMLRIEQFAELPKKALYRRFKKELVHQLEKALGSREELLLPVELPVPYHERLACIEPIQTAIGIEIGLQRLLDQLCKRLEKEGKGLRSAIFRCHRVDNQVQQLEIGTTSPSHKASHLFGLFKEKISSIEPALGIELFTLDAPTVEPAKAVQELLWGGPAGLEDIQIAEWMDRVLEKLGPGTVQRYLPAEHYWPERSPARGLSHRVAGGPSPPRSSDMAVPPDRSRRPYPRLSAHAFPASEQAAYHRSCRRARADRAGVVDRGRRHRDYYVVEDETGPRYWLFRSGHYTGDHSNQWFLHGFFG